MRKTEGPLCRFCLGVVSNENIGEIGENIKEMLEVLQFKLNFHISEGDIICSDCMRSIQECLDFKLTYQNVEEFIVALYSKSKSKLDLREEYIRRNKHITTTDIATGQEICRFCMKLNNISSFNPLITIEDMIQKCIPELNFNFTKKPMICDSCLGSLNIYFRFLQICVDTEEKIMKYLEFEATGSEGPVNLNKVVQFTKNISDNERDITKVNVYSDGLCCETNENNVINTEVIVKKEETESDTENFENDNKINVEKNIKIELKEESGILHNGELEMIHEQNELHNVVKPEVVVETDSAKFDNKNVENCIKTDIEENMNMENMEIKVESLELQNEKLEIIDEENELQAEQIGFESFQNAPAISQMTMKNVNASVYKCGSCSHVAKYKSQHKLHMLSHREYRCDSCSYVARSKTCFRRHVHFVHQYANIRKYKCEICTYAAKRKGTLKAHLLTHQKLSEVTVYRCDSCSFVTKYKGGLNEHTLITHQSSNIPEYKCESCSYVAKRKSHLKEHMLTHQELSEVTVYRCDSCSYVTKRKGDLKKHTLMTHQSSNIPEYKCESCSYVTNRKGSLKVHLLTHRELSEVTVYRCDSCSYVTKYKSGLNKHTLITHQSSNIPEYKCESCSYVAKRKSHLKEHMLTKKHTLITHQSSNIPEYKCESCSYVTNRKGSLKVHLLTHRKLSEIIVYRCASCAYVSRSKANLKSHIHCIHQSSSTTRYKCEHCSYVAKRKRSLNKHMLNHREERELSEVTLYT